MRPPHSHGGVDAGRSETTAAAASISKGGCGNGYDGLIMSSGLCRLCHADWRKTEVAQNPKKHGMILRESDLDSGHPLGQRCLSSSKCADSIHNSR